MTKSLVDRPKKKARIAAPKEESKKPRVDAKPARPALKGSRQAAVIAMSKGKEKEKEQSAVVQVEERKPKPVKAKDASTKKQSKPKQKAQRQDSYPTALPKSFKIVAGSYEKLLYGLDCTISSPSTSDSSTSEPVWTLKPAFIFPAHVSCIKAVAASPQGGKWLATGSADEIVKVWDLKKQKEVGGLMQHQGSITSLHFSTRSHLFSSSEDGTIALFHTRDWVVLRTLKGHKGRVNSFSVHPSGKVALSVGRDRALRMWDLMRCKGVASMKIGKEGEVVRWSTDGSKFIVQTGSTIDLYTTSMDQLSTVAHPSRIHDVHFYQPPTPPDSTAPPPELLLVGAEKGLITVYTLLDPSSPKPIAELAGHANRVKSFSTLAVANPALACGKTTVLASASSDGCILVFDLAKLPCPTTEDEIEELTKGDRVSIQAVAKYDSDKTRLTCITLADGDFDEIPAVNGKRSREEAEDGENDENALHDLQPEDDDDEGSEEDEEENGFESEGEFEDEGEVDEDEDEEE